MVVSVEKCLLKGMDFVMEIWDVEKCYENNSGKSAIMESCLALKEEKGIDEVGEKLLWLAAKYAHIEALKWLDDEGVDINITDKYEFTPLHKLAMKEFRYYVAEPDDIRECTRFLLAQGVSPLRKDENEYMVCYHYAARSGNYEFVEELNGKKLDMTDKNGNTGIHIACDYVNRAMSTLHYASDSVEKATKRYNETVERLAERNFSEEELAQYLSNNRIKTIEQAEAEYAGLVEDVDNFYKTVKAFVDGGVDPDEKNNYGQPALDIAVKNEAKKLAAYLSGEDVESEGAVSAGGMTIHQAVEKADLQALETIASRGVDLDEECGDGKKYNGYTPLAIASAMFDIDAVNLLIEKGANVGVKDSSGHTALYFLAKDAQLTEKDKRFKPFISAFINAGYNINEFVDDDSDTMLNYRCRNNSSRDDYLISVLLGFGADVNISNRFGQTPLMFVCKQDSTGAENIQISLLENGADVTAKDSDGNTALHYAAMNRSNSLAKNMTGMLFEFGKPDINAVNNDGRSPLDIATEMENEPLVKWLLNKM